MLLFLKNIWDVWLEAAPWLLFGLVIAGFLRIWFPSALISRWLGGRGLMPIIKAAIIGTPVPLCSCSVIPAALTLKRGGASNGATVSFLIATPENGADSLAISYALLGPFMTVVRPVAAIFSALVAGILTLLFDDSQSPGTKQAQDDSASAVKSCCASKEAPKPQEQTASCCSSKETQEQPASCCDAKDKAGGKPKAGLIRSLWFAIDDVLNDIMGWLIVGVVVAGVIKSIVSPQDMAQWGSGLLPMLAMLLIGIPMYICATASTPVAAAMLLAGVSPGTVLVFLLAGPATNMSTMGIVRKEMGTHTLIAYLVGICGGAIATGLLTDLLVDRMKINIVAQAGEAVHLVPHWLAMASGVVLMLLAIRPLYKLISRTRPADQARQAHSHST
jgi:uncharacterized membrane protein YraQ (UPF0718 family)